DAVWVGELAELAQARADVADDLVAPNLRRHVVAEDAQAPAADVRGQLDEPLDPVDLLLPRGRVGRFETIAGPDAGDLEVGILDPIAPLAAPLLAQLELDAVGVPGVGARLERGEAEPPGLGDQLRQVPLAGQVVGQQAELHRSLRAPAATSGSSIGRPSWP